MEAVAGEEGAGKKAMSAIPTCSALIISARIGVFMLEAMVTEARDIM
jgi:hypothetical protein